MSQYPEDEFDVAGRDRGPEGVHREPPSLLRALAPFIAVIVIVPLLAWGAVALLSGGEGEDPQADPVPTATAEETEEPGTPEETTEPAEEETTTPGDETTAPGLADDVVLTTSISVLNGAGISGIAGDVAGQLEDEGFTSVGAADYGSSSPDVTTLYYRNADLEPTAEAIGELIGVDNLVELASATQNVEIAIVLRPDFANR